MKSDKKTKMKFNNKIRNILLTTGVLLFAAANFAEAQTYDYSVNWSDTSTYKTTCGKVVPAQWSVKNDTCVMTTPYLRVEAFEGCVVSFNFKINQSGNGDPTDQCYVYHQIDDGEWVLDTLIIAGGNPAIYPFSDFVNLNYGHYIKFKICMATDSKTEFWAIKDGDMVVTDNNSEIQNLSSWSGKPPAPPEGNALPVELLSFNGNIVNGVVELNWSTASETNNNYFAIERSIIGIEFEEIGLVQGAGNSNSVSEYFYSDYTPFDAAYYRLKQTDFDGKFSYSEIIKLDIQEAGISQITVNGSGNALNLIATTETSGKLHIDIYNTGGNKVYSGKLNVEEGNNTLSINPEIKSNAIYIVNVCVNNELPLSTKVYLN